MELLTSKAAFSNALSGAAADCVSTIALFPLDAIKLQMQADSSQSFTQIVSSSLEMGMPHVYKGIGSKMLQGVQQKFQYFYVYALLKQLYVKRFGKKPNAALDLAIGYVSAVEGLATTMPIEVVNTRIITYKKNSNTDRTPGFWEVFAEQLKTEGPASFYKTLMASLILCINPAITYVVFEEIKTRVLERRNATVDVLTTLEAFVVGILSKSFATIVTFPFIRAKVLMNVWKKKQEKLEANGAKNLVKESPTMFEIMQHVVETEGFTGLYVGLTPQLTKAVSNAALMLSVKEKLYGLIKVVVMGNQAVK